MLPAGTADLGGPHIAKRVQDQKEHIAKEGGLPRRENLITHRLADLLPRPSVNQRIPKRPQLSVSLVILEYVGGPQRNRHSGRAGNARIDPRTPKPLNVGSHTLQPVKGVKRRMAVFGLAEPRPAPQCTNATCKESVPFIALFQLHGDALTIFDRANL